MCHWVNNKIEIIYELRVYIYIEIIYGVWMRISNPKT